MTMANDKAAFLFVLSSNDGFILLVSNFLHSKMFQPLLVPNSQWLVDLTSNMGLPI